MKNITLGFVLLSVYCSVLADRPSPRNLVKSQATHYIKHVVDTLLSTHNHAGSYAGDIKVFTEATTVKLLRVLGAYQDRDFWSLKTYNQDELYAGIVGEIITFIEEKALAYGREDINNFFVHGKVDENKVIQRVSSFIRDEALKILTQNTMLKQGILEPLVGSTLRSKVNTAIKRELKHIPVPPMITTKPRPNVQTLYETKECPLCYERFSGHLKRIFLPCGHNSCGECLKKRYEKNRSKPTCAYCAAPITTIKELLKELGNHKLYTTPECPVCLENFAGSCKRLYLSCGHNICVYCLKKWYDKKGSDLTCPCCARTLNILDYAEDVFGL